MIESVKLDWVSQKITVTLDDGAAKEYAQADKDAYLSDYPDRSSDIVAMGWNN
jgi:hypothetical protein